MKKQKVPIWKNELRAVFLCTALVLTPAAAAASQDSDALSLSERVAALESELSVLEEKTGIQIGELTDDNGAAAGAAAPVSDAGETDPQQFLEAAVDSFNQRRQKAAEYTSEELAGMNEADRVAYYYACVEAEDNFYNRYQNALFNDKNLQYYCHVYRTAMEQQKSACQQYQQDGDGEKFNENWYVGYYNRVVAITGLYDNYGAAFDGDTVETLRADIGLETTLKEELEANRSVDTDTVYSVQTMLNALGYSCGGADGLCGPATVRSVRHFQAMNKMTITGVIDRNLVSKLTEQAKR